MIAVRPSMAVLLTFISGITALRVEAQASELAQLNALSDAIEALAQKVSPAVVQIHTTGFGVQATGPNTSGQTFGERAGSGSGLLVDPDGYIVTNAHVIKSAQRITVSLATSLPVGVPGRSILTAKGKALDAEILGIDEETDLAILKVEGRNLPFLELADSDYLRPAQLVLAFGSPLELQNSVTLGVVSAVARQLEPEAPMIYIQTDAAINPGSSGGPLVDTNGRVIGINTIIFSHSGGSEGISFAAPSNIVRHVYEQIRAHGRVRRGMIAVNAQTITPMMGEALSLRQDWGVILSDVYPGGPADEAGLQVGDIILSLDGKAMENARQLEVNLYRKVIDSTVTLEVYRKLTTLEIPVTVIERPEGFNRFSDLVEPGQHFVPELSILAIEVDERILQVLPQLRRRHGVLVAALSEEFDYRARKFQPGDVIYTVNRAKIRTLKDLRDAIAELELGAPVAAHIERLGHLGYVTFALD